MKHKILLSILTLSISFPVFAEYKIMLNSEKIKIPEPSIPSLELTHTFTNCGKTGRFGPSESQCLNSYNNQDILIENFNFTVSGGIQSFKIDKSGTYRITAAGAQGGNGENGARGGYGTKIQGDFFLEKGQDLKILVGQKGSSYSFSGHTYGGGGGGSYVATANNTPLIVAGGGNGANRTYNGPNGGFSLGDGYGLTLDDRNSLKGGCGGGFYSSGNCSRNSGMDGRGFLNGGLGGSTTSINYVADGGFGGGSGTSWNGSGAGGGYTGGSGTESPSDTYLGNRSRIFNNGTNKTNAFNTNQHGSVSIEFIQ